MRDSAALSSGMRPHRNRRCAYGNFAAGYTLIELLAVIFVVDVPVLTFIFVTESHGRVAGIAAAIVAAVICVLMVRYWWRAMDRESTRNRQIYREKYSRIYRVIALPTEKKNTHKPEGAEIQVGDFAWEARPLNEGAEGLIYLQGLDEMWHVVWWAGFRPDQIDEVGPKPCSQYDWTWETVKTPCPFQVLPRGNTIAMGRPY